MLALVMNAALALSGVAQAVSTEVPVAPPPPPPEQVMALPEPLREQFRQWVMARRSSPSARLDRMVEFMFSPEGLGMAYQYDATHTVAQAYATRRANCLTFTLLAVALAREANLEAYGQQIDETLAWRQEENTVFRTNHVNAGVLIHQRKLTVDVAWDLVIARHPPERIDDARLIAHYYNNRTAELMAQGRLDEALPYARTALALDPGYANNWSNAGVLHMRLGHPAEAERHYLQALALQPRNPGALFNLATHYERTGNAVLAARWQKQLREVQGRDPFHQFLLAAEYERKGDLARAAAHYKRAIRLYPDEHRFHFGLARVQFQLGQTRRAGKALARARELSDGQTSALYQAKLDTLRRMSH